MTFPPDAKTLPMDLNTFGFITREKHEGRTVANRCGRDFLYYALTYYFPEEFNPGGLNPVEIERRELFGLRLPSFLIWTGLTFSRVPGFLRQYGLELAINGSPIRKYSDFLRALLPAVIPFEQAIEAIKKSVDAGHVAGIDLPVALGGLVDHVMFVYAYDVSSLYVFDTHQVAAINYTKITGPGSDRFVMRLPFSEIEDKWNRFGRVGTGRVWTVCRA